MEAFPAGTESANRFYALRKQAAFHNMITVPLAILGFFPAIMGGTVIALSLVSMVGCSLLLKHYDPDLTN
ncbi:MAG: hypothetical protein GX878_03375 [Firmicutes bacterium]|nr:hypothetical protein [Bacillota bacterium]